MPAIINKTRADWKFIRAQVSYVDMGNSWISFKFANVEDKEMVSNERPWHVNGLNLVLSTWLPFFDPYSTCIGRVDQWVRVPIQNLGESSQTGRKCYQSGSNNSITFERQIC